MKPPLPTDTWYSEAWPYAVTISVDLDFILTHYLDTELVIVTKLDIFTKCLEVCKDTQTEGQSGQMVLSYLGLAAAMHMF